MRAGLILLLSGGALFGQDQTNSQSGSCDQVINDNRGVITITCSGVDKDLLEQLKKTARLLDQVVRRQADPAVLNQLKGLNVKVDEILRDTRDLKTTVSETTRQLTEEQRRREQAEILKRTAPDIDPFLRIDSDGKILVMMNCRNLVPFEFYEHITRPDNVIFPNSDDGSVSVAIGMAGVYPAPGKTLFNSPTKLMASAVAGQEIKLQFHFKSLSADELGLPGHTGTITKKYRVSVDGRSLTPLP